MKESTHIIDGYLITASEVVMSIPGLQIPNPELQRTMCRAIDDLMVSAVGPAGDMITPTPIAGLTEASNKLRALGHDQLSEDITRCLVAVEIHAMAANTTRSKMRDRINTLQITCFALATVLIAAGISVYTFWPK